MTGIVWLASYPKSGNTWFRVFLTNLLRDDDCPASINELESTPIASARGIFDEHTGIDGSDLTMEEIDRLRPEIYTHLAETAEDPLFMKIHDAYVTVDDGIPLIPARATKAAIYFIRNPLDVAVSFAHHSASNADKTISMMANREAAMCKATDRLVNQLRQPLRSWRLHVLSWVDEAPFPVCPIRYEDMVQRSPETFEKAVGFAGLAHTPEQIQKALEFSSFEMLKEQEEKNGFREKNPMSESFFRKGRIGSWREELSEAQARRIIDDQADVMRRFGYLDEHGEIVY